MEVPQDRGTKDGRDEDGPKAAELDIAKGKGVRAIEEDFSRTDRSKVVHGNFKKRQQEEDQKIHVSGKAPQAEFQFKEEVACEHEPVAQSPGLIALMLRKVEKVDVFEVGFRGGEAIPRRRVSVDAKFMEAADQLGGNHVE